VTRHFLINVALISFALVSLNCGGRGGLPPTLPPLVTRADGKQYHLVEKGPYKAYYDRWGRLEIIEYDSNGDGRADHITHHKDGAKTPELIEIDTDFDGYVDQWEYYDPAGKLIKIGSARRGHSPDLWTFPGPDGQPVRREYDDDGDGRVDRAEILEAGRIVRVEIDADRDGRMDRWQQWKNGRLVAEELDINGDGKPDKRLTYSEKGTVVALANIP
jgi:hypothetical protein